MLDIICNKNRKNGEQLSKKESFLGTIRVRKGQKKNNSKNKDNYITKYLTISEQVDKLMLLKKGEIVRITIEKTEVDNG